VNKRKRKRKRKQTWIITRNLFLSQDKVGKAKEIIKNDFKIFSS